MHETDVSEAYVSACSKISSRDGSRVSWSRAKTAAVERLALWNRREEKKRKKARNIARRVFLRRHLPLLVLLYRKSILIDFWGKWSQVVAYSLILRRKVELITNKSLTRHALSIWSARSSNMAFFVNVLGWVIKKQELYFGFTWWKEVHLRAKSLEKIIPILYKGSKFYAAWGTWVFYTKVSSFSAPIIRKRRLSVGWRKWRSFVAQYDVWIRHIMDQRLQEINERLDHLATCFCQRIYSLAFKKWYGFAGVGSWRMKSRCSTSPRDTPRNNSTINPEKLRHCRSQEVSRARTSKARRDRANAQQYAFQIQCFLDFMEEVNWHGLPQVCGLIVEKPVQKHWCAIQLAQADEEQAALQTVVDKGVNQITGQANSGIHGAGSLRVFMPAGTKLCVHFGSQPVAYIFESLNNLFSALERAESSSGAEKAQLTAAHVSLTRIRTQSHRTQRSQIGSLRSMHLNDHYNVRRSDLVVQVLSVLLGLYPSSRASRREKILPSLAMHWTEDQSSTQHIDFDLSLLPSKAQICKKVVTAPCNFRIRQNVHVAENIMRVAVDHTLRPLFIVDIHGGSKGKHARMCMSLHMVLLYLQQAERKTNAREPISGKTQSYAKSGLSRHVEELIQNEEGIFLEDEHESAHSMQAVGVVYRVGDSKPERFRRHMAKWPGCQEALCNRLESLILQDYGSLTSGNSSGRAGSQDFSTTSVSRSVATRTKDLYPSVVIYITNHGSNETLCNYLDLHETLRRIPVNVIAFDAPKADRRCLCDISEKTRGIFQHVVSSEFI